mmetsp:Transcript_12827/g.20779  ORF Transcript_12827/g.20779 Transcript_12827/m.20779 type:complete len:354 (+) Transcript_12827:932-1993(+)
MPGRAQLPRHGTAPVGVDFRLRVHTPGHGVLLHDVGSRMSAQGRALHQHVHQTPGGVVAGRADAAPRACVAISGGGERQRAAVPHPAMAVWIHLGLGDGLALADHRRLLAGVPVHVCHRALAHGERRLPRQRPGWYRGGRDYAAVPAAAHRLGRHGIGGGLGDDVAGIHPRGRGGGVHPSVPHAAQQPRRNSLRRLDVLSPHVAHILLYAILRRRLGVASEPGQQVRVRRRGSRLSHHAHGLGGSCRRQVRHRACHISVQRVGDKLRSSALRRVLLEAVRQVRQASHGGRPATWKRSGGSSEAGGGWRRWRSQRGGGGGVRDGAHAPHCHYSSGVGAGYNRRARHRARRSQNF